MFSGRTAATDARVEKEAADRFGVIVGDEPPAVERSRMDAGWVGTDRVPELAGELHLRLALRRAEVNDARWGEVPADSVDWCARRDTQWAIGSLSHDEADAKDRRLLHFIEASVDGLRAQWCSASVATIAARTDLSITQVGRRLAALVAKGRLEEVTPEHGIGGYRVVLSVAEREDARNALRALWRRTPEYSGWLLDSGVERRDANQVRLLWTREVWLSKMAGSVKSAAIELSQFVNRTGDAPFRAVTVRELSARTGYSGEHVRHALDTLRCGRWLHITTRYGRGDRGAGLWARLRLPDVDEVIERYGAAAHAVRVGPVPPEVGTKPRDVVADEQLGFDEAPSSNNRE